ncbi:MAG: hypothetical protein HY907_20390 [Deltaproteobacteria bacterium]|nr:hypothetical protein [Deltaproteobacteria bacterium]
MRTAAPPFLPALLPLLGLCTACDGGSSAPDAADATTDLPDASPAETTPDASPDHAGPLDDLLRLDQLQVRGTHNSYHVALDSPVDPSHAYSHAPLDVQLGEQGVRAFELDVHASSSGEGLEVYHIIVLDPLATCDTLAACLTTIRDWSDEHRGHLPLAIWIEVKDDTGGPPISDLDAVDVEIRAVLDEDRLYTPDDLQGVHDSPRDRLAASGWPTLAELRGKVFFVLLDTDRAAEYTRGFTDLVGRAMFARADAAHYADPWAAIAKVNDPTADAELAAALAADLLVASNTCGGGDSDTACAYRLAAALRNGVHHLMDDIPAPIAGRDYWADLGFGPAPARCNPRSAPPECTPSALEPP